MLSAVITRNKGLKMANKNDKRSDLQRLADLNKDEAVILDTETTGFGPSTEILELAIISTKDGSAIWNETYKPVWTDEWYHAEKIHGISPQQVADKPHIYDHMRELRELLGGREVIIYNKRYDVPLFPDSLHTAKTHVCAMEAYKEWAMAAKWVSLINAAKEASYEFPEVAQHTAIGDCKATLAVVNYIRNKLAESLQS